MSRTACLLVVLWLPTLAACRTRPYDADGVDQPWAVDGHVPNDLSWVPDLTLADLSHLPDLLPPPDLELEPQCRDIWVVDSNGWFSAFDTRTATFQPVKFLRCPSPSTPQTMAVDRGGTAWVLYSDGNLFNVDVRTGDCKATGFDPRQLNPDGVTFVQAGSCFSSDGAGSPTETYFLYSEFYMSLNRIDTKLLRAFPIAQMPGTFELTGTADGELWAFQPSSPSSSVQRIDKQTGAVTVRYDLPQIDSQGQTAYAFAFWGGSFWIFNTVPGGGTAVYRMDRAGGQVTTVLQNTGRNIIGAGASSCAPLGLDR